MGAANVTASKIKTDVMQDLNTSISNSATQNCKVTSGSNQTMSVKINCSGCNCTTDNISQISTNNVDASCISTTLRDSLVTGTLNNQIQNSLTKSVDSLSFGIGNQNTADTLTSLKTNITTALANSTVQNCMTDVNTIQNMLIDVNYECPILPIYGTLGNIIGYQDTPVNLSNISQQSISNVVAKCLQNDTAVAKSFNDLTNALTQSSTSTETGFGTLLSSVVQSVVSIAWVLPVILGIAILAGGTTGIKMLTGSSESGSGPFTASGSGSKSSNPVKKAAYSILIIGIILCIAFYSIIYSKNLVTTTEIGVLYAMIILFVILSVIYTIVSFTPKGFDPKVNAIFIAMFIVLIIVICGLFGYIMSNIPEPSGQYRQGLLSKAGIIHNKIVKFTIPFVLPGKIPTLVVTDGSWENVGLNYNNGYLKIIPNHNNLFKLIGKVNYGSLCKDTNFVIKQFTDTNYTVLIDKCSNCENYLAKNISTSFYAPNNEWYFTFLTNCMKNGPISGEFTITT